MHAMALEIPEDVARGIRLPRGREKRILMQELAMRLFEKEIITAAQAVRLLKIQRIEFEQLLAENHISIHGDAAELADDLQNLDS